jgi:hypothetical protein
MSVELKKTITSIFMVPPLKINRESLKENGFINAYYKDGKREIQYENCIYLLFRPKAIDRFRGFLVDEYERTKSIIDDYDYEDGFVVVVYELDQKFKKDYELIKQGKYSKTSKEFQDIFPTSVKLNQGSFSKDHLSLQYRVFNKTEDLIQFWQEKLDVVFDDDQEIWYGFIEENETLNLDKIKEYVQ